MESPTAGDVVVISFPFSDLSRSKLRPAVVLASVSRGDFILCQVTSNPYADPNAIQLTDESFRSGSLDRASYARPGKLFTASAGLFKGVPGKLKESARQEIVGEVTALLRSGEIPSSAQ